MPISPLSGQQRLEDQEGQGHLWLHMAFEVSLGHMSPR